MNTTTNQIPMLPKTSDHEFLLEDLELTFNKRQLQHIRRAWNWGIGLEKIASRYKRDPDEVFLALFHLARKGQIHRSFGRRYIP
ncbi:hypothetical protein MUN89_15815 [Halobacillus salinarum]|uniref:Uncharacterized protein n=1 Tax=Halobacillus salinarum TaxID=2932257 RepID=A0ABY4EH38_9BACI|nr:hypothetical protein [Halobacillus salinarum]UOQ43377.1 hypothetical protein MUN89_15815 [Halobacillus salinarum]